MISYILAVSPQVAPVKPAMGINIIALVVFLCYVLIFALVISCLVRLSRYLRTAGKEQKLIRMELGKLAEEVHQIRQEFKNADS